MTQLLNDYLRAKDVQTPPLMRLAGQGEGTIFGFPIQVTEDAYALWKKLRGLRRATGYWPVFLGDEEDRRLLDQRLQFYTQDDIHEDIKESLNFDLEDWLQKKALAIIRDTFSFNRHPEKWVGFTDFPSIGVGTTDAYLGLIPREESWYTPAFLAFGGWNDNPPAFVHCALLRRWNRLFGADVFSITKEDICLSIQAPPREMTTAHQIRDELFMYCPDYPGYGIMRETGFFEAIINETYWYFRWLYPWNCDIYSRPPQDDAQNSEDNQTLIYPN